VHQSVCDSGATRLFALSGSHGIAEGCEIVNDIMERNLDCPSDEELLDFLNGKVSPGQLSVIADHLDECDVCGKRLSGDLPGDSLVNRLSKIDFVEGQKGPRTSEDPFELGVDSRYELIAELGEGGMGQVFKARHKLMKRTVALKTIRPELINHPEAVRRFAKEARAAARLSHPNIVTAFDAEQCGDLHMLVMEFVQGESVSMLVNKCGPLPFEQAVDYARQAAVGLQHAHERKMVHRDIKPQNLMLDEKGVIKILDFGLSKFRRDLEAGENDSVADETILTLNNISLGTEGFIAPEQAADARSVDVRSDIYSLGCTLFFMLTNRPPYFGSPPDDDKAVPDVTRFRDDLPDGLPQVLRKMMAPEPGNRYATPQDVVEALQAIDLNAAPRKEKPAAAGELLANAGDSDRPQQMWWPIAVGVGILIITIIVILLN